MWTKELKIAQEDKLCSLRTLHSGRIQDLIMIILSYIKTKHMIKIVGQLILSVETKLLPPRRLRNNLRLRNN